MDRNPQMLPGRLPAGIEGRTWHDMGCMEVRGARSGVSDNERLGSLTRCESARPRVLVHGPTLLAQNTLAGSRARQLT
jgi:hypothetical protein